VSNVRWSDEEEVDRGGAEADMGGLGYSAKKLKSGSNIVVDLCKLELGRLKGVHYWTPPTPILGSGEARRVGFRRPFRHSSSHR
jgi:hypothetical protein